MEIPTPQNGQTPSETPIGQPIQSPQSPQTSANSPITPAQQAQIQVTARMMSGMLCPQCHQPVLATEYFCPNCGKDLKEKPPGTKWWNQLYIYSLSFFLPPLGLWPAWKYIRSKDGTAQRVGWIAVALTVIAIVVSIFLFQDFVNSFSQYVNSSSGGLY